MNSIQDSFVEEATEILEELKDCLKNFESLSDRDKVLLDNIKNLKVLLPASKIMKMFVFHGHIKLLHTKLEDSLKNQKIIENMELFNSTIKASELALGAKELGIESLRESEEDDIERFLISHNPIVFIGIDDQKISEIVNLLGIKDDYFIFRDVTSFIENSRETPNEIFFISRAQFNETKSFDREFHQNKTIIYGGALEGYYNFDGVSISNLISTFEMMKNLREYEYLTKKSLSLVLYQLSDIEDFLIKKDDFITLDILKKEIKDLLLANKRLGGEL